MKGAKPGPMPAKIAGRPVTPAAPPSKGQLRQREQTGTTNPRTDGGGGVGNTAADLRKYLTGK